MGLPPAQAGEGRGGVLKEKLAAFIDARREDLISLLTDLVAARTENPPGNEHLAAKVVAEHFERLGIAYKTWEAEPGRTNIVGAVGAGRPRILVVGHLDVVPAGDGWRTDPFRAEVRGEHIYGRGTCDNKGATAALLMAGAFLKEIKTDLAGEVLLACVADEECGSTLGLSYLLEEGALDVDYALVPDVPENLRVIDIAEKGALFCEITSHGKQAHGSRPQDGVNAIWNMVRLLERIRAIELPHVPHPRLSPPTLNLGQIEGGCAPNMVPATCRATIDIRYLPGTTEQDILALIESTIADAERETGGRFDLKVLTSHAPTEVPEDSPLVQATAEASGEILGEPVRVGGMSGATVVKQLLLAGITSIGLGAGEPNMAHVANERVPIGQLLDLAKILALACLKIMDTAAQL